MFSKIISWFQDRLKYRSDLEMYLSQSQNNFDLEEREKKYFLAQSRKYFNL
jgi:hypothetical protein